MNNIDDGKGNKETRIKLIREESIGEYSWDTSPSDVNNGYGVNEWSDADLMKLLNSNHDTESVGGSLYWNQMKGNCYSGRTNATIECDFTTTGLASEAKKLIGEAVWHTGSNGAEVSYDNILTSKFYELERGSNNGKICSSVASCNDNVTRTTKWTGVVGLISPSDYGYATSGGATTDRDSCLNTVLYRWNGSSDCYNNDWLHKSGNYQWVIAPSANSSTANNTFYMGNDGSVYSNNANFARGVLPSIFLNANVKIVEGEGTSVSPFILSVE